jgi:hypothetical protein
MCTFTTRNVGEDPVVPLGLCKSGVAGLVILALCRRTPNKEHEKCNLQRDRCPGCVYVGLSGRRRIGRILKLTRMRYAGDTEAQSRLRPSGYAAPRERKEEEHIFHESQAPGFLRTSVSPA